MNKISFINYMLICLIITIVVELLVALLLKVKNKKDLVNVLLVNILTNPLLVSIDNAISVKFGIKIAYIVLVVLEILVVIVEGYIYKKYLNYKKINPYILSLILNICSYLSGLIIIRLFII